MNTPIDDRSLEQIFSQARTYPGWQPKPVTDATLRRLYDLVRWGPTSMNIQPMRLVFVRGDEARGKLLEVVSEGNRSKVSAAPVTVIIGQDLAFYEQLQRMAPHMKDPAATFRGRYEAIREAAFRNSSLQGGYLILAARALGLDTGPMSGFDADRLDKLFFAGSSMRSNFIMNIGYGDPASLHPRAPRFEFDEVCTVV